MNYLGAGGVHGEAVEGTDSALLDVEAEGVEGDDS
jgi:hypothetical protein